MKITIPDIPIPDIEARKATEARQLELTKPTGSLGVLEMLSVRLSAITGKRRLTFPNKAVIVCAGDHGVTAEGVSAYPAEVTPQMVLNMCHGGAAINALAKQAGARCTVVDVGVASDLPSHPNLHRLKVAYGTKNMAAEPAMALPEVLDAINVGLNVASMEIANGLDLLAVGEMGIGNTTAATAITAAIIGLPVPNLTGRGTGVDDERLLHKIKVIEKALALHKPDRRDPYDVLRCVGGLEIAAMAGVMIGAAAGRVPIVIDGLISGAAALIAAQIAPAIRSYFIAGHKSVEIGHQIILQELGLRPLLDLGLRLGEGSGAVLAFHIIDAAANTLNDMATFSEAAVSDKDNDSE